jgi:hypothetical protein
VALGRLRLEHVHEDDVADAELRLRLGVAAVELAVADDAFRLRADVDQDLVLVDAHDRAFDHVAVLEALDIGVLLGEQLLHRRGLGTGRPRGDRGARPRARCRPRAARRPLVSAAADASTTSSAATSGQEPRRRRASAWGPAGSTGSATAATSASGVRPRGLGDGGDLGVGASTAPGATASAVSGASTAPRLRGLGLVGRGGPIGRRAIHRRGVDGTVPDRPGSGLVSGAAGSSATAMAATVCSVAGASPEAVASGAGAVPPCCSSVKVILSPSWIPPWNHERPPNRARGRLEREGDRW